MIEIILGRVSKSDYDVQKFMKDHYSKPKGFIGRQLIYKIIVDGFCYGVIAAGSATKFLPGRKEFFQEEIPLNNLVNNNFFHIQKQNNKYPCRHFTNKVVKQWREIVCLEWKHVYGSEVKGFETLVELPRTGNLYIRDNWKEVGLTKGYSCKRIGGESSDSWTGKRIWNTDNLKPKRVFCRFP